MKEKYINTMTSVPSGPVPSGFAFAFRLPLGTSVECSTENAIPGFLVT